MNHKLLQQLCEAYVLGALDDRERQQMEEHLQKGCASCEKTLSELNAIVASLGFAAKAVSPRPEVKEKLLAKILSGEQTSEKSVREDDKKSPYLIIRAHEGEWQPLAKGVHTKFLYADRTNERTTMLMRMEPGARLASHAHHGAEELYVLEGDCVSQGVRLNPGDYHRAEGGSTHGVTSTENGCLMLVISPEIEMLP